jgi:hypothetical protein
LQVAANGQRACTLTGCGWGVEGLLSTSLDGKVVLLACYDAPVGSSGPYSSSVDRVIARIFPNTTIDTGSIIIPGPLLAPSVIQSVASLDGVSGWWFSTGPYLSSLPVSPSPSPSAVPATNQYGIFYTDGTGAAGTVLLYSASVVRGLTLSPWLTGGAGLLFTSLWDAQGAPNGPRT